MKLRPLPIALCLALASAVAASAATTISYSYQVISDLSDSSWVIPPGGSAVTAVNFGSGGTTNWGGAAWTQGFTLPNNDGVIDVDFANTFRFDGFHNASAAGGLLWEGRYGDSSVTLDLNGFTVGQEYLVQFVVADNRPDNWAIGRTITIDGVSANIASQDSSPLQYAYGDGRYAVVTARFVANESSFSFAPRVNNNSETQLNALNIVVIPEPSAALLGGMGVLALLRRRRTV